MDNSFVPTVVPKHSLLANVLGFYSSTYFLACLLVCLFNLPIFGFAYNCLFSFQSPSEEFHISFSASPFVA